MGQIKEDIDFYEEIALGLLEGVHPYPRFNTYHFADAIEKLLDIRLNHSDRPHAVNSILQDIPSIERDNRDPGIWPWCNYRRRTNGR